MEIVRKIPVTLDFRQVTKIPMPQINQFDSNVFEFTIVDNGEAADLSNVERVVGNYRRPDKTVVSRILTHAANVIEYPLGAEEMAQQGMGELNVQLFDASKRLSSVTIKVYLHDNLGADLETSEGMTLLQEIFVEVSDLAVEAQSAATYAKNQGDYAKEQAEKAADLEGVKEEVVAAATEAETQATFAKTQGDYAKEQADLSAEQYERLKDTDVGTLSAQLADKASKKDLDNMGSASPKGVYSTLSALEAALPTGSTGIYVVQSDGKWYYWSQNKWTVGGTYQATGLGVDSVSHVEIKSGEITAKNTDFLNVSTNSYNKNSDIPKMSILGDGSVSFNQYFNVTDFYKIKPSKEYTCLGFSRVAFYDKSSKFISYFNMSDTSAFTVTSPPNAYYIRYHYDNTKIINRQINQSATLLQYEDYYIRPIDDIEVDYSNLVNTPAEKVKNDLIATSLIYEDSLNDYWTNLATSTVVDDFDGFKSPTSKLLKISYPVGNTSIAYAMRKFSSSIGVSTKFDSMIFVANVYVETISPDETAEIIFSAQAGTGSYTSYDSFSKGKYITLEKGKPTTVFLELKKGEFKPFNNGAFGLTVKNATNPVEIYVMLSYIGFDTHISKVISNPLAFGDLSKLTTISKNGVISKTAKDVIVPSKIYVTSNDNPSPFGKARQYSNALYLDHLVLNNDDKSMQFADYPNGEGDKYYFYEPTTYVGNDLIINNGRPIDTSSKTIKVKSDKYTISDKTISQISTRSSLSKAKSPRVLYIGDSITQNIGANGNYGNGEYAYWGYVKKLFELDKIDGGDVSSDYNYMSLGIKNTVDIPISYKGVNRTVKASADGLAGWSLFNFLHHSAFRSMSQATWDLLGLGNGTGTDYTGTAAQKDLIASTNETNSSTIPANPYFDNNKTGNVKFSILKWLERFRTRDDNGNKLTLGDPLLGKLITTQSQIDNYNVCTPTHVVLAHGRNDIGYASINKFIENEQKFINAVKAELPNVTIGICTVPDTPGTFFSERYPKILSDINMRVNRSEHEAVKRQLTAFDNRENENIYIIPNFFVQPTAWGFMLQDVSLPQSYLEIEGWQQEEFRRYKVLGDGPNNHLGSQAHTAWGYQVYSWLKYVLSK